MTEYERGFIDGIKSKVSAELTPTLINVSKTMLEMLKPVLSTALENVMNDNNAITDTDVQPVNQWVSTKDRLPEESDEYLAVVDGVIMEVSYDPKQKGLICVWSTCDADGFRPLPDDAVTHWMPFPELPQD